MYKTLALAVIVVFFCCSNTQSIYRIKITIDHTMIFNVDQKDFPVLVALQNQSLRSTENGGHVHDNDGADIFFTLDDGKTVISHELSSYDPEKGILDAWIRIPHLSCSENTVINLFYGGTGSGIKRPPERVWDSQYVVVRRINNKNPGSEIPDTGNLNITGQITVQASVYSDSYNPEVLQPLVSKWKQSSSFDAFSAYDAGKTDGLDCRAYLGAVFDGRYVYFSPMTGEYHVANGRVLRYDTQGDFHSPESYSAYDAGCTRGISTKGYYGAVFDGRYVYFVPRKNYCSNHSRVLRYDTHMDFKSAGSWDAYDAGLPHTHQGAAFDGRYIYFSPGYKGDPNAEIEHSGIVIRYDTDADFQDPSSWKRYDAGMTMGLNTVCFDGAGFDGRYVYFAPLLHSAVLRYDTKGDFENNKSWRAFDAKQVGMDMNVGTVFDGRYLYFVPYYNSTAVRYDTHGEFTDTGSWQTRDIGNVSGLFTGGSDGGFFDGKYVYFVPFVMPGEGIVNRGKKVAFHANFLRYNTEKDFFDDTSWEAVDASSADGLETIGYNAGAFDGRYFYGAPWRHGIADDPGFHGRIQRYDTVGTQGSFSLRYCDYGSNGGLNAAVMGPSFIVNTVNGPLSVAAHKALLPGRHHIAGVYNGRTIKLFVDGVLAAVRTGSGTIQTNDVSVVIGSMLNNDARFKGIIENVRISNTARSDDWIKTEYHNQSSPGAFLSFGDEEMIKK